MQRPTGVTVLAVLLLISAAFRFVVGFIDMAIGNYLTAASASPGYVPPEAQGLVNAVGGLGFWIGLIAMGVALLQFIAARGIWGQYRWGWRMAVILLALGLVLSCILMLRGYVTPRLVMLALFDLGFLIYLFMPRVRQTFSDTPNLSLGAP